ncbi:MAG: FG-GAP-like repeat-containing protein [Terriglobales bacterium]
MQSRRFVSQYAVVACALFIVVLAATPSSSAPRVADASQPFAAQPSEVLSGLQPLAQSALFQHPLQYTGGGLAAMSLAVGDVNGDGIPDVVVASQNGSNDGTVGVLLGNGNGTFQPIATYDSGGPHAWAVAIADVNSDGKPDIVVMNAESGSVGVLLGHGDGTFAPAVTYNAAGFTISVADVNGDGKLDIITGGLDVLLGNGDGTFQPARNYGPGNYATLADVNGDGKLDIVSLLNTGSIAVLLGNGDGTFQTPVTYATGGDQPDSIAVGDLNGDGKLDIAVANYCTSSACVGDGSAAVLLGNGDGTFQSANTYDSGGKFAQGVAIADIDGDGKNDLVVASNCAPTKKGACTAKGVVNVLLGAGNGNFQAPQTFLTPGPAASITAADVNGGRTDLMLATTGVSITALYGEVVASATALASSSNPVAVNQSVTFTATITPSVGADQGGETVDFYDGTTLIGSALTSHGIATFTTTFTTTGKHKIKAVFPKNLAFKQSVGLLTQTVDGSAVSGDPLAPIVTPDSAGVAPAFAATRDRANYKQTLCPSKTKAFPDGGGPYITETFVLGASANMNEYCHNVFHYICQGQMNFYLFSNGAWNLLGPGTWVEECAWEYDISTLPAGKNRFKAVYNGDPNGFGPSSGLSSEYVEKWPTTATLTSTPNPSSNGQDVTFTASAIADPDSGLIPTGKMRFFNGTKSLGAVMVDSNGNATLITKRLPSGQDSITAEYLGDADNAGSTSSPYIQVVNQAVVENAEGANQ